jgi:hypothetical protein
MATKLGVGPIRCILYDTVYFITTTSMLLPSKARSPGTVYKTSPVIQTRLDR